MTDEQPDPETAVQRFESLLGRIVSAGKKDVQKAEQRAEEIVDDALGPSPATPPALADEGD